MLVAGGVLPLHGVGRHAFAIHGVHVPSAVLLVAASLLLLLHLRSLSAVLRRAPLALAWMLHALAELSSLVARAPTSVTPRALVRALSGGATVAGFTAACMDDGNRDALLLGSCVGGIGTVAVSLVGYLAHLRGPLGVLPFRYASRHPVLGSVPRLSGTFGHSPQHFGEYLIVLGAMGGVASESGRRRLGIAALVAAAVALALTVSWASVAGMVALLAWYAARGGVSAGARIAVLSAAGALACAGTWMVNVGPPAPGVAEGRIVVPCREVRPDHLLAAVEGSWKAPTRCMQLGVTSPYPHFMTLYAAAKHASLEAFRAAPVVGVGAEGFRSTARRWSTSAMESQKVAHYDSPHATYLGALATGGLLGGITVLAILGAFLWVVVRAPRHGAKLAAGAGVLGLLVVGLDIDILHLRHLWVLTALLGALDRPPA
jgi:hypothetical protein